MKKFLLIVIAGAIAGAIVGCAPAPDPAPAPPSTENSAAPVTPKSPDAGH